VLTVLFAISALNAWVQAVMALIGRSDDPATLTLLQLLVGISGAAAAWGSWAGRRWAPVAAVLYGLIAAAMLFAIPLLLHLEPPERAGLWSGAAGVLLGSIAAAWYLRRTLRAGIAMPDP